MLNRVFLLAQTSGAWISLVVSCAIRKHGGFCASPLILVANYQHGYSVAEGGM